MTSGVGVAGTGSRRRAVMARLLSAFGATIAAVMRIGRSGSCRLCIRTSK